MRIITTIVFATLMIQSVFSQDIEKCREVVKITTEAINAKSSVELEKHLASDFEIASQKGEIAKMVLKQLFTQLGDTVQLYKEVNAEIIENSLTLTYSINYKKLGQKEATFVFDEDNKLKELELFKMEVKTLEKDETKVEVSEKNTIIVPFTMFRKLIAVQAKLNGIERTFIFDSGNGQTLILNSKYIDKKDTATQNSLSNAKGVNGNVSELNIELIKQFNFSGVQLNNQKVLTLDLSQIEKSLETEIYGIIGYGFIKEYDILYDYDGQEITLIKPEYFENYKKEKLINNKLIYIDFEQETHIPVIKAIIDNKVYLFGIDCGAESNLIDFNLFSQFENNLSNISTDILSGVGNVKKEVKTGKMKKTFIGGEKFKKMNTAFSDISHLNKGYKIKIDGLFGYELLSKQKTIISYERKQMILIE